MHCSWQLTLASVLVKRPLKQPLAASRLLVAGGRPVSTLSPQDVTRLLTRDQVHLDKTKLPSCIKALECNQLASNRPIEDRLRVASVSVPDSARPALIVGVFDGHGGGTTADIITRRLFNYLALAVLSPRQARDKLHDEPLVVDLHHSPKPIEDPQLRPDELASLRQFASELRPNDSLDAKLKQAFQRCDDDLSKEIQENLIKPRYSIDTLHYYLSAAVSGCCAIVLVVHEGQGYVASTGDCRAVLGSCNTHEPTPNNNQVTELNEEHNYDNISEMRRLAASHPKTETNTMVKHSRLLGHLMPFRAFGDYNYKWPADLIEASGITKAFGARVIPAHYLTPPYLITEPEVRKIDFETGSESHRSIIMASDGLWELFESSRDVFETYVDHLVNSGNPEQSQDYDTNRATHIIRSALRSGSMTDHPSMNPEELRRLYHVRLESTLTLPQAVVRNFRDDISVAILELQ